MASSLDTDTLTELYRNLVTDGCPLCNEGVLVRDTYKGDGAVICETCETPIVRLMG